MLSFRKAAAVGLVAGIAAIGSWAFADGIFQTYPGIGQPSFCASTVSGTGLPASQGPYGIVPGQTQGTVAGGICGQTVPDGPLTFTGNEHMAVDVNAQGVSSNGAPPATATVLLTQLGNGPYIDLTTVTSSTIPNNTPFYFLDGAQTSNFTITMPATAVEGQIQKIICEHSTSGTLFVAANAGQSINGGGSIAACTVYNTYSWRYVAANTTWYRF